MKYLSRIDLALKHLTLKQSPSKYLLLLTLSVVALNLVLLSACQENKKVDSFLFEPYYSDNKISCEHSLNINEQPWNITQLQFYIANVELKDSNGLWQSLAMKVNAFQSNNVALIGANCAQISSSQNWHIQFERSFEQDKYTDIRFSLGVPFALNHLNPLQQDSPLNVPSMFWVWRSGHKFLRLELLSQEQQSWMFHLGSTGCRSVSPVRAPSESCINPNLSVIELPLTASNIFRFNLSALIDERPVNENTHCQSEPDNPHCSVLFERIGLTKKQRLFEVDRVN